MQVAFLQSPLAERRPCRRLARGEWTDRDRLRRSRFGGYLGISIGRVWGSAALLVAGWLFGAAGSARAAQASFQQPTAIRVTPSPQIFATLCALYAAGYPKVPGNVSPQMKDMILRLSILQGPAVTALRDFYRSHSSPSTDDTLARYISFAMVVGPPPSFPYLLPEEELPPDVRDLSGFQKLLSEFYTAEDIENFWNQVEPSYAAQAARLRGPVSQVVTLATGYARRMDPFVGDRTFSVYVEPLVGSENNFRIYSESYKIAVNPTASDTMTDIRLAFLHFLLDPLPFNNPALVQSKGYLLNYAVHAPRLPEEYKQDFVSFTDECLVRAVDLRLSSLSAASRQSALAEEDRDGYVLVRPLYAGLEQYEKSQSTLAEYFPKLIESIQIDAEAAREAKIVFAPASEPQPSPAQSRADRIGKWLQEGDRQIATQDGKGAAVTFSRILQVDPHNTRAQYGLAVASAMDGQAERARQLFEQVVSSPVADPSVAAWSHIYLGRMSDLAGHRQEALVQYRAALAIAGIPPAVRDAAQQGIETPFAVGKSDPGMIPHP